MWAIIVRSIIHYDFYRGENSLLKFINEENLFILKRCIPFGKSWKKGVSFSPFLKKVLKNFLNISHFRKKIRYFSYYISPKQFRFFLIVIYAY